MARLIEFCSEASKESAENPVLLQSDQTIPSAPESTAPAAEPGPQTPPPASDEDTSLIAISVKAYLDNCKTNGVRASTLSKYRNSLTRLATFAESNKIFYLHDFKVTDLDKYRASRRIAAVTSLKELEATRQWLNYCVSRDLCKENIAQKVKGPKIISPNDVEPYSTEEVQRIIAATQEFGRNQYERKRAKAIVLVLRYTALRISDVAVLRRDRIKIENGRWVIFIRATKNGKRIYLPIPREMKKALDDVPIPRKAASACPYYFWSGKSKQKSIVSVVEDCVRAVFKKSGVEKAHAHRFRHTLATELLGAGATFEVVADCLGDSVEVIKKHYAKWSPERQANVMDFLSRVHGNADWSPDVSWE